MDESIGGGCGAWGIRTGSPGSCCFGDQRGSGRALSHSGGRCGGGPWCHSYQLKRGEAANALAGRLPRRPAGPYICGLQHVRMCNMEEEPDARKICICKYTKEALGGSLDRLASSSINMKSPWWSYAVYFYIKLSECLANKTLIQWSGQMTWFHLLFYCVTQLWVQFLFKHTCPAHATRACWMFPVCVEGRPKRAEECLMSDPDSRTMSL